MSRLDEVTRQRAAAAAELEHEASPLANRLEQAQDARRACLGMEPVPEVVREGQIAPVVRPRRGAAIGTIVVDASSMTSPALS
jgi:hypothetical protein